MLKHNINEIKGDKNDAYVSDAVMIYADQNNLFEGTILEQCTHDIDVIMINLKANEKIKQHSHSTSEEIVLIISGEGHVSENNENINVKNGDIIFLEKNKKHGFEAGNNGLKLLAFHGPPMHDRE